MVQLEWFTSLPETDSEFTPENSWLENDLSFGFQPTDEQLSWNWTTTK